jgi:hypothetical protein
MDANTRGQEHGAAVRCAASFAAALAVALAKDIALNARRGGGYVSGFAKGLFGAQGALPNV